MISEDCDVTHFFQSGEGCDAARTNLVSGMKWKKTEQGTRNNGRELEMQQRHLEECSMPADLFGSLLLLFIQLPNIIRKRGLDVKDLCQKYVHSSEIGCNNNRCV